MAEQVRRVLVPIDFSRSSKQAFEYTLHRIKPNEILLLFTQEPQKGVDNGKLHYSISGLYNEESMSKLQAEISRRVNELIGDFGREAALYDVKLIKRVRVGDPRDTVPEISKKEHVDLIVVGDEEDGKIKRFFFGALSTWLFRNSQVPVLIAKNENELVEYPSKFRNVNKLRYYPLTAAVTSS